MKIKFQVLASVLEVAAKALKRKLQRLALALQIPFYNFDSRREKKSLYTVYEIDDLSAHTVEITEFYCHATVFSQKFRQINVLINLEIYYKLI